MIKEEGSLMIIAAPIIVSVIGAIYIASILFASYRAVRSEGERLRIESEILNRITETVQHIANSRSPEADSYFDDEFCGEGSVRVEDMSLVCLNRQRETDGKSILEGGGGFVHPLIADRKVLEGAIRSRIEEDSEASALLLRILAFSPGDNSERGIADTILRNSPDLWPAISTARPVNINLAPISVIEEAGRRCGLNELEIKQLGACISELRHRRELVPADIDTVANLYDSYPELRYFLGVKSWFLKISLSYDDSLFSSVFCATPSDDGERAVSYDMLAFYRETVQ